AASVPRPHLVKGAAEQDSGTFGDRLDFCKANLFTGRGAARRAGRSARSRRWRRRGSCTGSTPRWRTSRTSWGSSYRCGGRPASGRGSGACVTTRRSCSSGCWRIQALKLCQVHLRSVEDSGFEIVPKTDTETEFEQH
uniref:Uncharacterized protein n=2 Tax=Aegilops tauschii subsp. strangulata TaxID=200361 RepID=A0A453NSC1_AEGTS